MALAGGGTPDWTTMVVQGPTEVVGLHGRTWFQWTATVTVIGRRDLTRDPIDNYLAWPRLHGSASRATMPQPLIDY